LVTKNVPLDQVDGAFDALIGSSADSKILVHPSDMAHSIVKVRTSQ
jgi:hypothetical protein